MRGLAAFGLGLVAAAQVLFFVTGGDRPAPYRELQAVSVVATGMLAWGVVRGHGVAMAAGFGINALTRILQPVLGLTRLPLWLNAILFAGWVIGAVQAARRRDVRIGLWILGVGYALSVFTAFSRLTSALALTLTAAGLFLAAPNAKH